MGAPKQRNRDAEGEEKREREREIGEQAGYPETPHSVHPRLPGSSKQECHNLDNRA